MRILWILPALMLLTPAAAPIARPARQYTIDQFMNAVTLYGASFSADESRILFSSNKTGIYNAYTVPVGGGQPTAITSSTTDSTFAVSFFRTDDRILYTRARGGNELEHLYVRTPDGQERDLTPGDTLKAMFAGWTRDGTAFFAATNERDQRFFDVYRYDAASYERTLFYKNEHGYFPERVSGDGKWLVMAKPSSLSHSDLYVWQAGTSRATLVSSHMPTFSPTAFDHQSTHLYYLSNEGSEFTRLRRYALNTGAHEDVERRAWDITSVSFSHSGRYRAISTNEDGLTVVSILDTQTGKAVTPLAGPGRVIKGASNGVIKGAINGAIDSVTFARSETRMAFYVGGDRAPRDLYAYETGGARLTRLTNTLNPEIDPQDLVDTEVVRYESFDGTVIPSILFKPHQATPARKAPALVWVHGGPSGQAQRGYSALLQYLVNHGYVVLAVNNRGSSGYGKTFLAADDRKHGKEPLWDCVEGRKYLASLPYVDANRIGIAGSSYGGYMVLAALAFQPDAFAVGIDIFGISNWLRTLENMPPWWEGQRAALYAEIGDPATQTEMLREISPLFHAGKIRKPLFVLQGANDPRVLQVESDDIVAAVKRRGVPVEYLVFPDEGHGFTKKKNMVEGYGALRRFLDTHLKEDRRQ